MKCRVAGCVAFATLFAASAIAQEPRELRRLPADLLTMSGDIMEASRLMAVNPDAAIALLHQLNARFPGRDDVLAKLGYGMQVVGKEDSAMFYYRTALQANPMNLDAGKSLGSIYFDKGRERDAMQLFDNVLAANNYSIGAYKVVSQALRDLGRTDKAIDVLEQGRKRTPQNRALSLEIAAVYSQAGDNRKAIDEYLAFIDDDPRNYRLVRARMLNVLQDAGDQQEDVVSYLTGCCNRGGAEGFAAMDVLAAHYLERGLLEHSLNMALSADANDASDGETLLALAQDATDRASEQPRAGRGRYLDLGLRAAQAYVKNHPEAANIENARWLLAGIYVQYGSGANPTVAVAERAAYLERAVNEYADIARQFPGSDLAEKSFLERGDVLLRKLKRPDQALNAYKTGSVNAHRLAGAFASRIAEVYIGTNAGAQTDAYLKALSRAGNPELAQTGRFYTGLHLAMEKQYTLAKDTLTSLAEAAPSAPYTNDAIETAWVIEEATMFQSQSLDDWFAACRAKMTGDSTIALARYRSIGACGIDDPVRPRALHAMGLVLFDQGSYDASLSVLRRYLEDYPNNDDSPVVLRTIGRVYETGLGEYDSALHEYEQVLMSYPDYAMLDDIRRDIKRLRDAQHSTSPTP